MPITVPDCTDLGVPRIRKLDKPMYPKIICSKPDRAHAANAPFQAAPLPKSTETYADNPNPGANANGMLANKPQKMDATADDAAVPNATSACGMGELGDPNRRELTTCVVDVFTHTP